MTGRQYSAEEIQVIDDWCKRFPAGKGVDLLRIQAEDTARWNSMIGAHNEGSIRDKCQYHRRFILKDVDGVVTPTSKALSKPGSYPCYVAGCSVVCANPAQLGAHVRFSHPGHSKTANKLAHQTKKKLGRQKKTTNNNRMPIPPALEAGLLPQEGPKFLKHCPDCGAYLEPYHAAANLNLKRQ